MHEMAGNSHNETPLEILKRRFALGEITKEQYEEMRKVLLGEGLSQHH
jgi:uncharacterized membrane protein